jgi:glycosyltransferase involved in cell wall biosynthesis
MFGMWGMNVPGRAFAGFESAFSIVGPRLVEAGHEVVIYCRKHEYPAGTRIPQHLGVRLVYVPSWGGKNFSGVLATFFSLVHALLFERLDVFFFVNVGMGHHCALARLFGRKVVLNVDGLDWRRDKWGRLAKAYFYSAAQMAVRVCTRLVTDAEGMRTFYRDHFGVESTMIAYGAEVAPSRAPERVREAGVMPGEYFLIVSRLIPENNLELMFEGYLAAGTTTPLLVVGSANYDSPFHRRLADLAEQSGGRIRFTGHVHDQALLQELWCNARAYLHGHCMGGTNPALLRAMGHGVRVLAHDNVFNREVLADAGLFFPDDPAEAQARIRREYTWEKITAQYEALFREVAAS